MTLGPKAPERRRRLIVDAALDVLRERGFSGARMADIAGTSPALVAYHFGTLSTVLAEALTVAEDRFYAELAHVLSARTRAEDRLWSCVELAAAGGPRHRRLGAVDGGIQKVDDLAIVDPEQPFSIE